MSHFYSHLVSVETVIIGLDKLDLSLEQKVHLAALVDEMVHQTVLDIIFSNLAYEDQVIFTQRLKANSADQGLIEFLKEKIKDFEQTISEAADLLKEEFQRDIKEAQKNG